MNILRPGFVLWGFLARTRKRMFLRAWKDMQLAGAAVVLMSCRESGLWFLPTSDVDRRMTFSPPSANEHKLREQDSFGFASISVTWASLFALERCFGPHAVFASSGAIFALNYYRDPSGGYGTPLPGLQAGLRRNLSARHTAMAMLTNLCFGNVLGWRAQDHLVRSTICWLLDKQLPKGGWVYEEARPEGGVDPLGTSAIVVLFLHFLHRSEEMPEHSGISTSAIENSIKKSFSRIFDMAIDGIWSGNCPQTQIADSAFIIKLLKFAAPSDSLSKIIPHANEILDLACAGVMALQSNGGWPTTLHDETPSISSTLGVRLALGSRLGTTLNGKIDPEVIQVGDTYILKALSKPTSWMTMHMWDWAYLMEFATRHCGPATEHELNNLLDVVLQCRRELAMGPLTITTVKRFPRLAQKPILYCLARGNPTSIPMGKLEAWAREQPTWVRIVLVPLFWAVAGAVLGRLVQ